MKIKVRLCNHDAVRDLKTAAFTCRGKQYKELDDCMMTTEQIIRWIIAEHTPVETIQLCIEISDCDKSSIAQFVRHTDKHPRHFVQSSRPDLNGGKPRDPNQLISYTSFYNPLALVQMMRKRLCNSAEKRTRQIASEIKYALYNSDDKFLQAIAFCCVPNCVYRDGCPEKWTKCNYDMSYKNEESTDKNRILKRYQDYNTRFYLRMKEAEKK